MPYTPIEDYFTKAIDERTPTQFKEKFIYTTFLKALMKEVQITEELAWDVYNNRNIHTAVGVQLDNLGKLLSTERPVGMPDDQYRTLLFTRVMLRRSSGTPESLMSSMASIYNSDYTQIYEHITEKYMTGGIVMRIRTQNEVTDATLTLNKISPTTTGCVVILRDRTPDGMAWTPQEVTSEKDGLVDEKGNQFVTDTNRAIVTATDAGGRLKMYGAGCLADAGLRRGLLKVNKEPNDEGLLLVTKGLQEGALAVEKESILGGRFGYMCEVSQLVRGKTDRKDVEGES